MRILFADDHSLVRQTLRAVLKKLSKGKPITIDEAESLAEVLSLATSAPSPSLIILDLSMPGMDGPNGILSVRAAFPKSPVLILSGYFERATVKSCFNNGAAGFVPKTSSRDEFLAAASAVLQGNRYIPPLLLDDEDAAEGYWREREFPPRDDQVLIAQLSDREREMLVLLSQGKTNKEVARIFTLQEITIKVSLQRLYRKIGAKNRASAVQIAYRCGLLR